MDEYKDFEIYYIVPYDNVLAFLLVIGVSGKTIENTDTTILLSDSEILVNDMKIGNEGDIYISRDIIYYESRDFYKIWSTLEKSSCTLPNKLPT